MIDASSFLAPLRFKWDSGGSLQKAVTCWATHSKERTQILVATKVNHAEHRDRGSAQVRTSTTHGHGMRATNVSGRSTEDMKIMAKAFVAEKGMQANSKAWHNVMHKQRMAIAHAQRLN